MDLKEFRVPLDEEIVLAARDQVGDLFVITKSDFGGFLVNIQEDCPGESKHRRVELSRDGLRKLATAILNLLDEQDKPEFVVDESYDA